ncbi:MAG TPA: DUF1330 domain-containing protein [Pseudonocardia sp.]
MTAYVISDVEGLDPELVARYRELARASIECYDGVYLTGVGNTVERIEGDWSPTNIVLVRFPSMHRAREWYASPDYAPALVVRRTALRRNLIFVAGVDEP